jgi:hypothetical protein
MRFGFEDDKRGAIFVENFVAIPGCEEFFLIVDHSDRQAFQFFCPMHESIGDAEEGGIGIMISKPLLNSGSSACSPLQYRHHIGTILGEPGAHNGESEGEQIDESLDASIFFSVRKTREPFEDSDLALSSTRIPKVRSDK